MYRVQVAVHIFAWDILLTIDALCWLATHNLTNATTFCCCEWIIWHAMFCTWRNHIGEYIE